MDLIIGGVAVVGLAMDRDRAVGADRDAVQQLFEIGAVVLAVAEGDARRPVGLLGAGLRRVGAREGDGGGVLVKLAQVDVELADGTDDQGGE